MYSSLFRQMMGANIAFRKEFIDKLFIISSNQIGPLNDKLTWDANTRDIVKISNARMRMLHMMGGFQCASGGTDKHLHLVYMICF